ncbi:MAG: 30S ribosomal protein S12 methylthiotransferase RimO [Planctomycetota bacterium]
MVSLGCPKNLVDSEFILGRLGSGGYRLTPYPELADVLMVNTCAFIEAAKQESIDNILELASYKESDPGKKIVVAGCLGQRYPEELLKEVPEIDAIIGLSEYHRVTEILNDLVGADRRMQPLQVAPPVHPSYSEGSRLRLTAPHTTYLRISEGCDNACTFCAIPTFRGKFRSKPVDIVVDEARALIATGATELNLISQDLTSFGYDLDGKFHLPELLERLDALDGVRWIRLLYAYPFKFSDAMIDAVANLERVVKYIDMPIQHIHDKTLKRMGRRMDEAGTRRLFERMRARIPGLVLRTTFIVGFPGETEAEFDTLKNFVADFKVERVGVFTYSDEDGTPAVRLPDKVPAEVAEQRKHEIMSVQQEVAFAWNDRRIGREELVLIDGPHAASGRLAGRSYAEAPEIDSRIYLPANLGQPGEYHRVRIAAAEDYDLCATPLGRACAAESAV